MAPNAQFSSSKKDLKQPLHADINTLTEQMNVFIHWWIFSSIKNCQNVRHTDISCIYERRVAINFSKWNPYLLQLKMPVQLHTRLIF